MKREGREFLPEKDGGEKSVFSEIKQVGIVVRDLERAKKYYESIGIGPFESPNRPASTGVILRGEHSNAKHKLMLAQLGSVQLELLQPVEGESLAMEYLQRQGEGIQHIAFQVDDIEAALVKLDKLGVKVLQRVLRPTSPGAALLETDAIGGVIIELIQRPSD